MKTYLSNFHILKVQRNLCVELKLKVNYMSLDGWLNALTTST